MVSLYSDSTDFSFRPPTFLSIDRLGLWSLVGVCFIFDHDFSGLAISSFSAVQL